MCMTHLFLYIYRTVGSFQNTKWSLCWRLKDQTFRLCVMFNKKKKKKERNLVKNSTHLIGLNGALAAPPWPSSLVYHYTVCSVVMENLSCNHEIYAGNFNHTKLGSQDRTFKILTDCIIGLDLRRIFTDVLLSNPLKKLENNDASRTYRIL